MIDLIIAIGIPVIILIGIFVRRKQLKEIEQSKKKGYIYLYPRPSLTVDMVVLRPRTLDDLGMKDAYYNLEVLLIKRGKEPFKDHWALPGGFVNENERTAVAAARELREETNLDILKVKPYFGFLGVFDKANRDPRGWTVSVAYAVHLSAEQSAGVQAGDDAAEACWFSINDLPPLAFDHDEIIERAVPR